MKKYSSKPIPSYDPEAINDPNSGLVMKRLTKKIAIHPKHLENVKEGLRESLEPLIGMVDITENGQEASVLMSIQNIKVLGGDAECIDEERFPIVTIQGNFIYFQVQVGSLLKARVAHATDSFIGCLIHDSINAAIPKSRKDGDDWLGHQVAEGQDVLIKVRRFECFHNTLAIRARIKETL